MKYIIFLSIFFLCSCSTYMENKIGENFKSIQPEYTNIVQKESKDGTVYDGGGGLFASDRRANNVGDIITISLEESMSAANSGSETLSKNDSYVFDLPEAIFGPSSLIGKFLFPGGVKENNLSGGTTQSFTGSGTAAQANTLTGTISVVNDDSDASVEVSNLTTAYLLAAKELGNGGSVYAKLGYSHADIDNAKQSNGTTTINSFSDSLEGPMVGIGFQTPENSLGLVFRAEATMSEFDDVEVKTTDTDGLVETKKANDIEFQTFTVSIAKKF